MPKCDFNEVALRLYWNHTLTCVFSCEFGAYFKNSFFYKHLGGCFCCLLKVRLLLHENWKSYKCRQKKYLDFILASLQGCITVDSYTSASLTLTHENCNVHPLVRWVIAMILGYLSVIYLKIAFNTRWDIFSTKGLTSSYSGIFRFLTRLETVAKAKKIIMERFEIILKFC